MGFTWEYGENHDYVSHLDGAFRQGNAPKLAGMMLNLANFSSSGTWTPRYLNIHKIEILAGNDGEYRSRSYELVKSHEMACDEYSILQGSARSDPRPDLTVEQFFYHADILSGQDIGKVKEHLNLTRGNLKVLPGGFAEDAVGLIDAARAGESDALWARMRSRFDRDNGELWGHWNDAAGKQARAKFEEVDLWFRGGTEGQFRQAALRELSGLLIEFAATIHGARLSLDNLMGRTVQQVEAWNNEAAAAGESVAWAVLSGIKNVAAGNPLDKAFAFVDTVNDVVNTIKKDLAAPSCYDILASYLVHAEEIVEEAAVKVEALTARLNRVRDGREYVKIPQWKD
jgi:hypothetical protein